MKATSVGFNGIKNILHPIRKIRYDSVDTCFCQAQHFAFIIDRPRLRIHSVTSQIPYDIIRQKRIMRI
jgi:hypothetical protein